MKARIKSHAEFSDKIEIARKLQKSILSHTGNDCDMLGSIYAVLMNEIREYEPVFKAAMKAKIAKLAAPKYAKLGNKSLY